MLGMRRQIDVHALCRIGPVGDVAFGPRAFRQRRGMACGGATLSEPLAQGLGGHMPGQCR
jgi:hypothetical protein